MGLLAGVVALMAHTASGGTQRDAVLLKCHVRIHLDVRTRGNRLGVLGGGVGVFRGLLLGLLLGVQTLRAEFGNSLFG
jgi:hypothetical protein